jgi:uncharacterized membrane protein
MSVFPLLVIVHALAATVWSGGHLVLDLGVLPRALRDRSPAAIHSFEETFEPLGLTALAIKVLTGLWMGWIYLPGYQGLFNPANPIGMLVGVKLLLAATAALAPHARLRLIPNLSDANLTGLAWHIRGIAALAIAFVGELGMVPVEGCRQPQAGGVADASRGDAVRTESHVAAVLAAVLPSSPSCWRNQALSITPPLMQHQPLLRRGLGVALWSRRHQRADLHAADRCGTCLRVNPQPPAGELQRRRATGCGGGVPPGRDRAPGSKAASARSNKATAFAPL